MATGLGRSGLWQQQRAPALLVPCARCSRMPQQHGSRHRRGLPTLQPARRPQLSAALSSAARVTMQAAPGSEEHPADARFDVPAQAAAADSTSGAAVEIGTVTELLTLGAVADVEELCGVRVNVDDVGQPLVEYVVHWKVATA